MMARIVRYRKWLIAAAALIGIYALGSWGLRRYVVSKLDGLAAEKSASLAHFSYAGVSCSLLPGRIRLTDVKVEILPAGFGKKLNVEVPKLTLDGLSYLSAIFSKKLKISDLKIENPTITLTASEVEQTDKAPANKKPRFQCLEIGHLEIVQGTLSEFRAETDTLAWRSIDTFDLKMSLLSCLLAPTEGQRRLTFEDADMTLQNLRAMGDDGYYDFSLERFHFSKKDSLLKLGNLAMQPKYSKQRWAARLGEKKSRLDFSVPEIQLRGWDFYALTEGHLTGRLLVLDSASLEVFSDLNMPDKADEVKIFPQEALLKSALKVSIDSVLVRGASLHYEQLPQGRTEAGDIWFRQLEAVVTNVTNDSSRIAASAVMAAQVRANFQGKYPTVNEFWFDLKSADQAFSFKGKVAKMPFVQFNPFVQPIIGLTFDAGEVDELHWSANANRHAANGELVMSYDGLEFTILNKKRKPARVLSALADLVLIRNDNQKGSDNFKTGKIDFERDVSRSFFSFWWSAIQSGLRSSMLGVGPG